MPDNLKDAQPTVFFGCSRIWEKFQAGSRPSARRHRRQEAPGRVDPQGRHRRQRPANGGAARPVARAAVPGGRKAGASKLSRALGLAARRGISGAARSARTSSSSSPASTSRPRDLRAVRDTGPTSFKCRAAPGSAPSGPALPGVQVKIADDGENLVKGPNVFLGYFKEPQATAETLIDGWLHSGDLGTFDRDGYLTITGRKKEIIITAGGKNIAPKNIEGAIKDSPLVSEAVVIGDRRKYLVALITLDDAAAAAWMKERGQDGKPPHLSKELTAELQKLIDDVNTKLARVEQVKRFSVLPRQFGIDTGELTPTLKVKRKVVNKNFAAEIESLYVE